MDPNKEIVPAHSTQEVVQDVRRVVKRRKKLLILTPLLFLALSLAALYVIEPKYESSTSILIQKEEEPLNPLVMFDLPLQLISEDRLKSFNEIVYSRSSMEKLIDSLGLDEDIDSELEKQKLVDKLKKNIETNLQASDSFEITYYDTDPVRARDGAALLASHFIETRSTLDNRRKDETVKFFQTKIEELEDMVDSQREEIVNTTTEQLKEVPIDDASLQNRLQNIDNRLDDLEWKIIQEENKLEILGEFLNQDSQDFSIQPLYKLSLEEIPLGRELGQQLEKYDRLRERFTDNYPELRSLRTQILETSKRIPPAINSKLSNLRMQQQDLNDERASIINDMEKNFVASQRSNNQQSNYTIYQDLYTDMKVKLEQARMAREVGDKATEQFVVLDHPYISEEPSSPNNRLVVAIGFILGLIFAGIFIGIAEVLDTTIRSESDLEYQKPIIAYLADG